MTGIAIILIVLAAQLHILSDTYLLFDRERHHFERVMYLSSVALSIGAIVAVGVPA